MAQLKRYIRPYYGFIFLTFIIKMLGVVAELLIPALMETILDDIVPAGNKNGIFLFGGLMLLCAFSCLAFNVLANRMSAKSSGKITLAIRHDLFAKLQGLSSRQMDALTVSSAESRLTSDTYNVNQFLARIQRLGVRAPLLLIGCTAIMLTMDFTLALVLICLLPVIGIIVFFVTKKSLPLYTRQQTVLDRVVRTVQENITGIRVIKALSKTEYEKDRFHAVNQELTEVDQKAGTVSAFTNPSASLVLNIGLVLVVVVGAYQVRDGHTESGVLVAFLQYFTLLLNSMLAVSRIFILWSKGEASAKRVASVLAEPDDLTVIYGENPENTDGPHIEFKNVTFSYTGKGNNLSNLSFALQKGQTLGILGATGAGKSTIINLLLRLYDPDEGQILIDGKDIRSIAPQELRHKFGIVFQNDFVAEGSISDNIRFFRAISNEAQVRAAEDAQAAFIREKEGSMNAHVAVRGNNLSGGQKQRLLIARALASDPEILILDDASSALDYRTDANLRSSLRKNYRDTTTVLVAQRISSLRHADLILVLDDGNVIGAGNHETLMRSCEEYRMIAHTQMGDGKEEA